MDMKEKRAGLDELELAQAEDQTGIVPNRSSGEEAARRAAEADMDPQKKRGEDTPDPINDSDAEDATAWLLASFSEQLPPKQHTLLINVGTPSHPRNIRWTIQSVDEEFIDKVRLDALSSRSMRRAGVTMPTAADTAKQRQMQLRIIIQGTVTPNIRDASKSTGLASPEEFLKDAFKHDSGLIDQIANAILLLSGYDDELIQDDVEIAAAGN